MTNPHIDQARAWAEGVAKIEDLHPNPRAAVGVIQSLPDRWIDAEELEGLKESLIDSVKEMPGIAEQTISDTIRELVHEYIEWIDDILPAPPLQNLAELVEQGNDPQGYQWMQSRVFPTASTLGIITGVDEYAHSAMILFTDGMVKNVPWEEATPLPDLQKLEWPGSGGAPTVSEQENVAPDQQMSSVESLESPLPRPEDVPAGEPWLVLGEGRRAIGYRNPGNRIPWTITYQDCMEFDYCYDVDITLVSRLVPEVAS